MLRVLHTEKLLRLERLDYRQPEISRVIELVQMELVELSAATILVNQVVLQICLVYDGLFSLVYVKCAISVELSNFDCGDLVP